MSEIIDDAFEVSESRYGLWNSEDLNGRKLLTSLTKDIVVEATRWYLKAESEGTLDDCVIARGDGRVGGKL